MMKNMPAAALDNPFHLRLDGTGYPRVVRPTLNLGTMLCGIADVYDAMRSQRVYQEAFPTDRILAVLQRNDGSQFDQHLDIHRDRLEQPFQPGHDIVALVVRGNDDGGARGH